MENETRTLLENMHKEIKRIAEGQSMTSDKVVKIEQAVSVLSEIKTENESIKMAVMDLNREVIEVSRKLDKNLENHEQRVIKLEEKVHI